MDIEVFNSYEINSETLALLPVGMRKTRVYEIHSMFEVNMSPLMIIKNSCLFFGSSYEGRRDGVKKLLNVDFKIPILIEDSKNIIFFPVSGCVHGNSIWISYQNLIQYEKEGEFSTVLLFRERENLKIDAKYNLIDNQVIRCIKLESLLIKRKRFDKVVDSSVVFH